MYIELKTDDRIIRVTARHAVKLLSQTSARPMELLMAMRANPYGEIRTLEGDLVCRPSGKKRASGRRQ